MTQYWKLWAIYTGGFIVGAVPLKYYVIWLPLALLCGWFVGDIRKELQKVPQ